MSSTRIVNGRLDDGHRGVSEAALGEDLDVETDLFVDLSTDGLGGVLVGFDVAAGVEPDAELAVVDEQGPVADD